MAQLIINNKKEFDQQVWQTETGFDTKQYNEWMHNASNTLAQLRTMIEDDIDNGCCAISPVDLYIMGDVINLLSSISVDADHRAESWTCTRGDFDGYVLDGIDEDEINEMIDQVGEDMGNNSGVAESYWQHVEYVTEEHGLQKHDDIVATANMIRHSTDVDYQYVCCTICTKDSHERMEAIIALHPYDEVSDANHDEDIYFYCNGKDEFFNLCMESREDFTICAIKEYYTEI